MRPLLQPGLRAHDFLNLYSAEGVVKTIAAGVRTPGPSRIHIRGTAGSLDAVIAAAVFTLEPRDSVFIMQEKEEAAYFQNDLQSLLGREVLLLPMSYRRPYEYDETENANVLMRAEVLSRISEPGHSPLVIVTYPEALGEKVVSRKSLSANTFGVSIGENLDTGFLEEFLRTYGFEKTDFVYEAGQFAVRGGIIDVFSFAHEYPYRIELFGDEVDSIRSFDPGSQLSVEAVDFINILPDVQTRLMQEERQSFLEFISRETRIWFKDVQLAVDVVQKSFEKVTTSFRKVVRVSNTQVILSPEKLFDDGDSFEKLLTGFTRIEFGNRFVLENPVTFEWASSAQPAFNKNFELLANNLVDHQSQGFVNFMAADVPRQLDRLRGIFEEIHPELHFTGLEFSLRQGFVDSSLKFLCYTDHQIFERFHRYRAREKFSKSKALTLRELQALQPGDFVTHIDYGIGKFAGLEKKEVNGHEQEAIRLVYRDDDILYVSIHALHKISKYSGKDGAPPAISKLGS